MPPDLTQPGRLGAESVYRYLTATVRRSADGASWRTLGYNDAYVEADTSIFNGNAGISLFLADFSGAGGPDEALTLAAESLRWCDAHTPTDDGPALCWGRAGLGLAWLRLWVTRRDRTSLGRARAEGDAILATSPLAATRVVTDWIGGLAGTGVFLLRLAKAAGDERYRAEAVRYGAWLEAHASRDGGLAWPMEIGGQGDPWISWGFVHGLAGIGYFFALLHADTRDPRWADLVRECAATLDRAAVPDREGLNWPVGRGDATVAKCQWCHGAPGVGMFYLHAAEMLHEPAWLDTAKAAGIATYAWGDCRGNPSQCHGLAGNAELLLQLFRTTGDAAWAERALDFAGRILAYRTVDGAGERWQADTPGFDSPDFLCGASGTGHFFLRMWTEGWLTQPLL